MAVLPQAFFARDVVDVAQGLLGQHLQREDVVLRITEVEAYRWPGDTACHARSGRTDRNAPLWGPPGHVYMYLCYGLHQMLNLVAQADGEAAAVLIRSCEPVAGLERITERRRGKQGPVSLTGPGKVGQALALDRSWCFHPVYEPQGLTVVEGTPPARVAIGPRIGIDYAEPEHRALPWRWADADSAWVTHRRGLQVDGD